MADADRALSKTSPILAKLIALLAERDRLVLLPDLLASYRERLLDYQNVVRAEVTTAVPLAADRAQAIERGLAQLTGRTVTLATKVEPGDHRRRRRAHRQHGVRRQRHDAAAEDETETGGERLSRGSRSPKPESRIRSARDRDGHKSRRDIQDHPRADRQLRRRRRCGRGGQHHLDWRRHRARPRRRERDGGRDARVPARRLRHRAEPRRGERRRRAPRRVQGDQGRRSGQADRPHHLGAGRRGAARPRRQRARPADRRQGPDRHEAVLADRAPRARASSIASRSRSRCRPG